MQFLFVALLYAFLANIVGAVVIGFIVRVKLVDVRLAETTDIANDMRCHFAQWILAEKPCLDFHAGKTIALHREARHFRIGQTGSYRYAFEFLRVFRQLLEVLAVLRLNVDQHRQFIDERLQVAVDLGRRDFQSISGIVLGQHYPVPVQYQAAVRGDGDNRDAVIFCLGRIIFVLEDLQPKEAHDQEEKTDEHEYAGDGKSHTKIVQFASGVIQGGYTRSRVQHRHLSCRRIMDSGCVKTEASERPVHVLVHSSALRGQQKHGRYRPQRRRNETF